MKDVKKLVAVMLAVVSVITTGCTNTVEKMEESDYIGVMATVESTAASEATTAAPVTTEPVTEAPTEPIEKPSGYEAVGEGRLEVETILQNPELPTGCEVTALATVLKYIGLEIDKVELCDNFLPIDPNAYHTFDEAYIGNPKANNGFGCYAPVIVKTAEDYFASIGADSWKALNLTDTEFRDLFYQIDKGRPVIVWSSMNLKDVTFKLRWTTEDGDEAWFAELEHCMVLTGYDLEAGVVYAADPLKGDMDYSLERFEDVYNQMGKRAALLYEEEK